MDSVFSPPPPIMDLRPLSVMATAKCVLFGRRSRTGLKWVKTRQASTFIPNALAEIPLVASRARYATYVFKRNVFGLKGFQF